MQFIKFIEKGKWHDKPYQPQFEVNKDDVIEIGEVTNVKVVEKDDKIGRASMVSTGIAKIAIKAKKATMLSDAESKKEAEKRNAVSKSEDNPAMKDKKKAEK